MDDLTPEQLAFLVELDTMIDSTLEFIADDELTREADDPEGRFKDLDALNHVRILYIDFEGIDTSS